MMTMMVMTTVMMTMTMMGQEKQKGRKKGCQSLYTPSPDCPKLIIVTTTTIIIII